MKLILHIGTHKTASTSIQHFCTLNKKLLKEHGIHYPKNPDNAYTPNYLASRLANEREDVVRDFLKKAYEEAKKRECSTVLISAESFYAISGFFLLMHNRPFLKNGYWENENYLIERLAGYCDIFDNTQIVCYLRPQEEFATSLYNQMVKSVVGITDDYQDFVEHNKPVFDYEQHLSLWAKNFGQDNVHLRRFQDIGNDPAEDFCRQFLKLENTHNQAKKKDIHANERLSRDVLEFKREQNKIQLDRALTFISILCYRQLSEEFPDNDKNDQIYAPLSFRQKFFSQYKKGNEVLDNVFNLGSLPVMTRDSEPTYKGLTDDKKERIERRLNELLKTPRYQTELKIRRIINKLIKRSGIFDAMLNPVRILRNWIRLRLEGW